MALIIVTTGLDVVNAGDGLTSLREALVLAQGMAGDDTIEFDASVSNVALTSALTIDSNVIMNGDTNGDGLGDVALDGQGITRILNVNAGVNAILTSITLQNGYEDGGVLSSGTSGNNGIDGADGGDGTGIGGSGGNGGLGTTGGAGTAGDFSVALNVAVGGVFNEGTLTLNRVILENNSANGLDGGNGGAGGVGGTGGDGGDGLDSVAEVHGAGFGGNGGYGGFGGDGGNGGSGRAAAGAIHNGYGGFLFLSNTWINNSNATGGNGGAGGNSGGGGVGGDGGDGGNGGPKSGGGSYAAEDGGAGFTGGNGGGAGYGGNADHGVGGILNYGSILTSGINSLSSNNGISGLAGSGGFAGLGGLGGIGGAGGLPGGNYGGDGPPGTNFANGSDGSSSFGAGDLYNVTFGGGSGGVNGSVFNTISSTDTLVFGYASDMAKVEGTGGSTTFSFHVHRLGDASQTLDFDWEVQTYGGYAIGGSDFVGGVLPSGTATLTAGGSNSAMVTFEVAADAFSEGDESFNVVLTNLNIVGPPTGAGVAFGTASFSGTIIGDDQGDGNNNVLTGTVDDDQISGFGGNDVITDLAGSDTIDGGTGDDLVLASAAGSADDFDFYDGGDDVDTIDYSAAISGITISLSAYGGAYGNAYGASVDFDNVFNFENIIATAFNDTITGSMAANDIQAGLGDDMIIATAGADMLDGGANGATGDTVSYANSSGAVQVVLDGGPATGGDATGDVLTNVENLIGSNLGDILTGNANNNFIDGLLGNDTLNGLAGDDVLVGGFNQDTLNGGDDDDELNGSAGNDTLDGGAGNDTGRYDTFGGAVTINLNITSAQNTGAAGTETISSIENLIGGIGNDRFIGKTAVTRFDGGGGSDQLFGLGGDDILNGDGGNDGVQGGAGNDILTGGAGRDTLSGGANVDILDGGVENDQLRGGAGSDTLTGGEGRDVLIGGDVAGGFPGDGAVDTFVFNAVSESAAGGATRDIIRDFEQGLDVMDLSAIDAITGGGDDAFTFIGTSAFSNVAGELRTFSVGLNTVARADVDGDGTADFEIFLNGILPLASTDFVL